MALLHIFSVWKIKVCFKIETNLFKINSARLFLLFVLYNRVFFALFWGKYGLNYLAKPHRRNDMILMNVKISLCFFLI